jgi:transposase
LKRAFLGWLRGEAKHCSMAPIPGLAAEDARRAGRERQTLQREASRIINRLKASLARLGIRNFNPKRRNAAAQLGALCTGEGEAIPPLSLAELRRELARLDLVRAQIKAIAAERQQRLTQAPDLPAHRMTVQLARVHGLGLETGERLATEAFNRALRDQRAVARQGGLTGAPDESGRRRREKGLARAGNARVRHTMIQLAWRWRKFQPQSELAQWFDQRTRDGGREVRNKMIVALARKLLIALWRFVMTGEVPQGAVLRPAAAIN